MSPLSECPGHAPQKKLSGFQLPIVDVPSPAPGTTWSEAPDIWREFPPDASVWPADWDRRDFLKLMGASIALGGIGGCYQEPEEKIVPYVRGQAELTPGKPLYFATAMPFRGYGLGLLAESHMGRPTKIEGNPEHPASLGSTDVFAQASILGLYDPDRSQTVWQAGTIATWDGFLGAIAAELPTIRNQRGAGLRILTETTTSPSLTQQLTKLLESLPEAKWHQYEPTARNSVLDGAKLAFGRSLDTIYHFEQAQIILSLDADFLSEMPGSVRYARDFINGRRMSKERPEMNRLYAVESTPTLTGAAADHRRALAAGKIEAVAIGLAKKLKVELPGTVPETAPEVDEAWLNAVVADLEAHRGTSLVIAGDGQSPAVHALAHALNGALENIGKTVAYIEPVAAQPVNHADSLRTLVEEMQAGRVEQLVMLGGNPVYNAPAALKFQEALSKVRFRIHLSDYLDETSFLCDWHIPAAHYLEAWSDVRAYDGTASIIQPLIAPLYGGRTAQEVISLLSGQQGATAYDLLREYWKTQLTGGNFEAVWEKAIHDGVIADSASKTVDVRPQISNLLPFRTAELAAGTVEINLRPDPNVWDGRFANNSWLQELPKPLTKLTWDNPALMGSKLAASMGFKNGDLAEITIEGKKFEAPVWVSPDHAPESLTLFLGYGRKRAGNVGTSIGYDAYSMAAQTSGSVQGKVTFTGKRYQLITTQDHWSMMGRDIVRVKTQQEAAAAHAEPEHPLPSLYPEFTDDGNAWGMVIDQTSCIGCNACVIACQAENNIPVVGKDRVASGREMHWLRVDRYFEGEGDDLQTHFQPMMCVHCEKAPCEMVCPVGATTHSAEGLNEMTYNRCVGTRYCSNNCPYKVRRFNFFSYLDTVPTYALQHNPDVTIRSRGVMEKCSYCVQRINSARIDAKKENRLINDGEILTACQQACPTQAIVFGNLNDQKSQVRKLKESPLNYGILEELNTQPRTTHLARVINPHPDLAKAKPVPAHGHAPAAEHKEGGGA